MIKVRALIYFKSGFWVHWGRVFFFILPKTPNTDHFSTFSNNQKAGPTKQNPLRTKKKRHFFPHFSKTGFFSGCFQFC